MTSFLRLVSLADTQHPMRLRRDDFFCVSCPAGPASVNMIIRAVITVILSIILALYLMDPVLKPHGKVPLDTTAPFDFAVYHPEIFHGHNKHVREMHVTSYRGFLASFGVYNFKKLACC
jgi:hypothetical protein